ncbi:MAG: DnaB-like helicase C-terminal domain-containing protein, partial [Sedimenticolaceae bacterium]|nr:DnaB-like helicase C-terminal domain-containing protein [Sedimenticolaceae bacterium]
MNTTTADNAERAMLGAIMRDPKALSQIAHVQPEHMRLPEHAALLTLMRSRARQGLGIGMVELPEAVAMSGQPDKFGGLHYVVQLADAGHTSAGIVNHAQMALEAAARRHVRLVSYMVTERLLSGLTAKEVAAEVAEHLQAMPSTGLTGVKTLSQCVRQSLDRLERIDEGDTTEVPISTGLDCLDGVLNGGLRRRRYVIIGARPGMGKTALGMQLAMAMVQDCAERKLSAVVFSAEMSGRDLADRVLAGVAQVMPHKLARGSGLTTAEWERLYTAEQHIEGYGDRLHVDDTSSPTVSHIRHVCEQHRQAKGGLDMVLIDYFQILGLEGGRRDVLHALNQMSTALLALARELDCCVVLLSQLNRNPVKGQPPTMADLKSSGQLEQDAHVIILPYRPGYDDDRADPEEAELIVAKNRGGQTGALGLRWNGPYMRFEEQDIREVF